MDAKTKNQMEQELLAALQELRDLEAEAGHQDEAVRKAIEEDHRERMKAAKGGGRIRDALSRRKSKVREVEARKEELPFELHVARTRVAELRKEQAEALRPELEAELERTEAALPEADREFEGAKKKHEAVHAEHNEAGAMYAANEGAIREAEFELRRLHKVGPQVEVTMPQSPNMM